MPSKLKPPAFAKPVNAGEKLKANTINPTTKDFKTVFMALPSPKIYMNIINLGSVSQVPLIVRIVLRAISIYLANIYSFIIQILTEYIHRTS
jgi:hypothetical protein